ncbi:MAG: restriction endonuclease [Thermoflexales bacterium]
MVLPTELPSAATCLGAPILLSFAFLLAVALAFARDQAQQQQTRQTNERVATLAGLDSMSQVAFRDYILALLTKRGYAVQSLEADPDTEPAPLTLLLAQTPQGPRLVLTLRYNKAISAATVRLVEQRKAALSCTSAMIITSGYFRADARQLAARLGCVLVDRDELVSWILEAHPEWKAE